MFSYLTIGENREVGFIKVGENISAVSEVSRHPRFRPDLAVLVAQEK